MTGTIRNYTKSDRAACLEVFKHNVPQYFALKEIADFEQFLDSFEAEMEAAPTIHQTGYLVLLHNHEIIGCGGFGISHTDLTAVTFIWGFVHPKFHKQGFGKQLFLHRLAQLKIQFVNLPIILDTTQFSYTFFEKYGFKTTKIQVDYYAPGYDRYDMSYTEPA